MAEDVDEATARFFADLPQQSPGTDEDTIAVLRMIGERLPPAPAIVDFGCGTGRTALALATRLPVAQIVAIDATPLFIETLRRTVSARDLTHRVSALVGDMANPTIDDASVDLIWCEGAAYAIGFGRALERWRRLLRGDAWCVVSECEWLSDAPCERVRDFWRRAYPLMADRQTNVRRARDAGFQVVGTHTVSSRGWALYYGAIAAAIADGRAASLGGAFADHLAEERDIYEQADGSFGYVFYVMRPA